MTARRTLVVLRLDYACFHATLTATITVVDTVKM